MSTLAFLHVFLASLLFATFVFCEKDYTFTVITVATDATDGFARFNRSINVNGLNLEVLGLNQEWKGGDVQRTTGGGFKVNLLKNALEKYKEDEKRIVMFVDSYDVVINSAEEEIVKRFLETGAKVLFSAEGFCWPDKSLTKSYPKLEKGGKRFLNSGGFIGYAPILYSIVTNSEIGDQDDDQLYYTHIYLNDALREKWSIKLDHRSNIFQNLNGAIGDVELVVSESGDVSVKNTAYLTYPLIFHGNGASKTTVNSLGNYLAKSWTPEECSACKDGTISLQNIKPDKAPMVVIGLFIEHATPFLLEFFQNILNLRYPKERIRLVVHNAIDYHESLVEEIISNNKQKYINVKLLPLTTPQWQARNMAVEECLKFDCDYYLSVDSDARLTNDKTLIKLIEQNRKVIAPMLVRPKSLWANFWGALSHDGFYARSHDYIDICKNKRRGVWNVPHISEAYLIQASLLREGLNRDEAAAEEEEGEDADSELEENQINTASNSNDAKKKKKHRNYYPTFVMPENPSLDADMAFSQSLRDNGVFMFVSNLNDFGHLVNSDSFVTHHKHNDLYEIHSNQVDWERRYIHENYSRNLDGDHQIEQPCPDVHWFPVVSETFCKHIIEELENYGKWSDGGNSDPRLAGGYENVPTRDIHMNQIGFEQQWLYFLREYIRPVQEKIYIGYYHDPPQSLMNFVVRYHPEEQPSLRPHHDSSTYTINIALNRPKIDYEGGGCRFIRYNCSVIDLRVGWSLIHPGRLTHYHEGLPVTNGVRYIFVSFVDP